VALRADGTVVAWGRNDGNATAVPAELTNRATNTFVRTVALAAAGQHNLALRADGSLRWWGPGAGNNPLVNPAHPTNAALGLENATNPVVTLGLSATPHAAAVRRNGQVVVWGNTNAAIITVNPLLRALVPMGGADSDRDGWANEAELRVGSDPLSTHSVPVKASFGITFGYGTNPSTFLTNRAVAEGTNRVVGALEILDAMGRREDGNQPGMQISLAEDNRGLFTLELAGTNRTLRFVNDPVHSARSPQPDVYQVKVIVRDGELAAETVSTLEVQVQNRLPTLWVPSGLQVAENSAAGTAVGTALGADEDMGSWRIVAGQGADYFQIHPTTGQLTVKAPADYEALPANAKSLTFTVEATDTAGATVQTLVAVQIGDLHEGSTFTGWSGGREMTAELVGRYAIGGASGPEAADGTRPGATLVGGNLVLTAIVRTDDPKVSVVGEAVDNLANYGNPAARIEVAGVESPDQGGVPEGHQRMTFTVPAGGARLFIRLKAALAP
jgi:hypothetical protein